MMNVPYAQNYQMSNYQQAYPYVPNHQTVPQCYNTYPQTVQQPPTSTIQTAPTVDNSRVSVNLLTDLVAESAALVELNKIAVDIAKKQEKTTNEEEKIRLQLREQDLSQLIAQREAKINQINAQLKIYET